MIRPPDAWPPYDFKAVSDECAFDTGRETLVQQHFAEEVDINTIVRRFGLTGQLPQFSAEGIYGDFTGVTDYGSAVEMVRRTEAAFEALPAEVREKFRNDPAELVRFASSVSEDEFVRATSPVVEPPLEAPAAPVAAPAPGAPVSAPPVAGSGS